MYTKLVRSGGEITRVGGKESLNITSLADAYKRLDIDIGHRYKDYYFNGTGLAR